MSFVKIENGSVLKWPYSFRDLRNDNRQVSFPSNAMEDPALLASFGVYEVVENPPIIDENVERYILTTPTWDGTQANQEYIIQPIRNYLEHSQGPRHPTSAEIQAELASNPDNVLDYYMSFVGEKVENVAIGDNLMEVVRDRDGTYRRVGNMQKAAKYSQLPGSPRNPRATALLTWEDGVWTYVEGRWAAVLGGATPPTWSELEADIDLNHPVP